MPNIMMYGFHPFAARDKSEIIERVIANLGLTDNTVITVMHGSGVIEAKAIALPYQYSQPFIRVCSDGTMAEINVIIDALAQAKIGVDCEVMQMPKDSFRTAVQMGASHED